MAMASSSCIRLHSRTLLAVARRRPPRASLGRRATASAAGPTTATQSAIPAVAGGDASKYPTSTATTTSATSAFKIKAAVAAVALFGSGFLAGRVSTPPDDPSAALVVLPNGLPRTCCNDTDEKHNSTAPDESILSEAQFHLPARLRSLVGADNVHDGRRLTPATAPFLTPARATSHLQYTALCIVTPRHLHHVVDVVEAAVAADCVVLVQGQNTGLTGGSVPRPTVAKGLTHDKTTEKHNTRPVVLVSLKHLDAIFPLDDGKRVVCLAGVGLASVRACANIVDACIGLYGEYTKESSLTQRHTRTFFILSCLILVVCN